jgi:hypothetical protein
MLGFSNDAAADWQGTVWGMSPEEANKNFRIPHHPPPIGLGTLMFDTYTAGNLDFIMGQLYFSEGNKLYEIAMQLKDPSRCDELIETLRQMYGKPAQDKVEQKFSTRTGQYLDTENHLTWYDKKNRNEISLRYLKWSGSIGPDCFLSYKLFIAPAPGSL